MEASSPARLYCLLVGGVLVIAGIIGFFYEASFDTGDSIKSEDVFGVLAVNGWHNLVHIAIGGLLLVAAGGAARGAALFVGVLYIALTVLGFIATGGDGIGFVAENGVLIDLVPGERRGQRPPPDPRPHRGARGPRHPEGGLRPLRHPRRRRLGARPKRRQSAFSPLVQARANLLGDPGEATGGLAASPQLEQHQGAAGDAAGRDRRRRAQPVPWIAQRAELRLRELLGPGGELLRGGLGDRAQGLLHPPGQLLGGLDRPQRRSKQLLDLAARTLGAQSFESSSS